MLPLVSSLALGQGGNFLVNPSFTDGTKGWGSLYTRDAGEGEAQVDAGRGQDKAIKIVATGQHDWAWYQDSTVSVTPGEVVTISAWMKTQDARDASISVETENKAGKVIEWTYADVHTAGTHDWQPVRRRFVVPAKCADLRFRVVGDGPGTVWVSNPSLVKNGRIEDFAKAASAPISLVSPSLEVSIAPNGALTASTPHGRKWEIGAGEPDLLVTGLRKTAASAGEFSLYDVGDELIYTVKLRIVPSEAELEITVSGGGKLERELNYPGPFKTQPGEWAIIPMNEGIGFPVDDPTAPSFDLITYSGHGICMPWYGVTDLKTGAGVTGTFLTPDDAILHLAKSPSGLLEPTPGWQPSRQELRYPRVIRLDFLDQGGYVAQAKRYRRFAKERGLLRTLKEKQAQVPAVDRLVGAMNVWNWDMEPVELCRSLQALGIQRVLWSRGGTPAELKTLNSMGVLTSRYDIYQDVWDPKIALDWMNTVGWPDSLVDLPDGSWMHGWAHPLKQSDGSIKWLQGGVISSGAGLARAKQVIPAELKDHAYLSRFLDTTTASPFREDYNPLHPLTRTQDRENKMALLDFCSRSEHLVVGSETGIDCSVPYLDYFEGMMSLGPYRLPDSGTDMMAYRTPTPDFLKYQIGSFYRLPLWELVYHDCTVAQWYWGDASNKAPEVWDDRDLWNILYGTAPLIMFDKTRFQSQSSRIAKTYKNVCLWARKVGYSEMVSQKWLSMDHSVQESRFANGQGAVVNFSSRPWISPKVSIPPHGFLLLPSGRE